MLATLSKGLLTQKLFQLELFTPHPLRAVGVLFSPMVSGWAGKV